MLADFSKPNVVIVEKPPDPRVERGKCSEESYLKELDSLESVLWEIRQDLMWTSLKVHQFLLDDQVFYELEGFKSIGEQLNNIKLLFFSVRHSSRIFLGQQMLFNFEGKLSEEKYREDNLKKIILHVDSLRIAADSFDALICSKEQASADRRELAESIYLDLVNFRERF